MAKTRVSTTVDSTLLVQAREAMPGANDASVMEAALRALIASHLRTEIDATYQAAYEEFPLDTPDAWGDLEGFHEAARKVRS
jgi:hypothetical protein